MAGKRSPEEKIEKARMNLAAALLRDAANRVAKGNDYAEARKLILDALGPINERLGLMPGDAS